MIEVKFGTPVPFTFREIDNSIGLDMEIHARLNGMAQVEDYDTNLYDCEDKVREAIKSNINGIITRCLNDRWNKEISVISKWSDLLGPMMDEEFKTMGITAVTFINSLAVLPEDNEKLREIRKANLREPAYTSVDGGEKDSFEKAIKENAKNISWCCSMCKTMNTGGMCSYCGFPRPHGFWGT